MTTLKTRLARFGGLVKGTFDYRKSTSVIDDLAITVIGMLVVAVVGPVALVGVVVCGK